MQADPAVVAGLIEVCREAIAAGADQLCILDSAIGDGDHGTNMCRGFEAVHAERAMLSGLPLPEALQQIGLALVMNIGGASGPLYGTLLIEIGRHLAGAAPPQDFAAALAHAIGAVARRGRAHAGDKTLLDVLYPVHAGVVRQAGFLRIAEDAQAAADGTAAMKALRGRAAFLGERSIGHIDPGASSCALLTTAICRYLKEYRRQ